MMGINRANIYGVKATEIPLFREAILIAFNLNILFHKKIEVIIWKCVMCNFIQVLII